MLAAKVPESRGRRYHKMGSHRVIAGDDSANMLQEHAGSSSTKAKSYRTASGCSSEAAAHLNACVFFIKVYMNM